MLGCQVLNTESILGQTLMSLFLVKPIWPEFSIDYCNIFQCSLIAIRHSLQKKAVEKGFCVVNSAVTLRV